MNKLLVFHGYKFQTGIFYMWLADTPNTKNNTVTKSVKIFLDIFLPIKTLVSNLNSYVNIFRILYYFWQAWLFHPLTLDARHPFHSLFVLINNGCEYDDMSTCCLITKLSLEREVLNLVNLLKFTIKSRFMVIWKKVFVLC